MIRFRCTCCFESTQQPCCDPCLQCLLLVGLMNDGSYFLPIGWMHSFLLANVLLNILQHRFHFLTFNQIITCSKIWVSALTGPQPIDEFRERNHPVQLFIDNNNWVWVAQSWIKVHRLAQWLFEELVAKILVTLHLIVPDKHTITKLIANLARWLVGFDPFVRAEHLWVT